MASTTLTFLKNAFCALQMWVEEIWQDTVNLRLTTAELRKDLERMQAEIDRLRAQVQHHEERDRRRQYRAQQAGLRELYHQAHRPRLPHFGTLAPSPDPRTVHTCLRKAARELRRIDERLDSAGDSTEE
jgi:chromosome segregation ATPase